MVELISLGCGGGRYQTLDQTFRTGGFRIHDEVKLHIDPGPGALLLTNQLGLNPMELDGVVVSHSHPDHYADAEVLIDAMYRGDSGGVFLGNKSAIDGAADHGPLVSRYHRERASKIVSLKPGENFDLRGLNIESTPTEHTDPTAIGLKFSTEDGTIGYTGDTGYFEELPGIFVDSRILIANVTRPGDKRIYGHLCSDDLIKILNVVEPELAVVVHMGMLFLRSSPKKEAKYVEEKTGVRSIPGYVGMKVDMCEEVNIIRKSVPDLTKFS